MKLTEKEIDLIEFLYEHTILNSERNKKEMKKALGLLDSKTKNINDYIDMFETSISYQDDDRLTDQEEKIIERLWEKINKKQTQDYLNLNKNYYKELLIEQNDSSH